jgi:hypothetical protein
LELDQGVLSFFYYVSLSRLGFFFLSHFSDAQETLQHRQEKKKRALDLLMLPLPYDDSVALVLCQMHGFLAGRRHLYEKTNAYALLLSNLVQI